MLQRLRNRASDEGGFTLIELLVVVLIIGILAAIAIPTFLNQTSKANDASAESLVKNAEVEAQTIATDHEGSYDKVGLQEIHKYEKNIPVLKAEGTGTCATEADTEGGNGTSACLVNAYGINKAGTKATTETTGFVLTAESPQTKDKFTITDLEGTVSRSCVAEGESPKGSCVEDKW